MVYNKRKAMMQFGFFREKRSCWNPWIHSQDTYAKLNDHRAEAPPLESLASWSKPHPQVMHFHTPLIL